MLLYRRDKHGTVSTLEGVTLASMGRIRKEVVPTAFLAYHS
jgi:hypothetical protein